MTNTRSTRSGAHPSQAIDYSRCPEPAPFLKKTCVTSSPSTPLPLCIEVGDLCSLSSFQTSCSSNHVFGTRPPPIAFAKVTRFSYTCEEFFLLNLPSVCRYEMVSDPELEKIISWSPDGERYVVPAFGRLNLMFCIRLS